MITTYEQNFINERIIIAVFLICLYWGYVFMINFMGRISNLFRRKKNLGKGKISICTENSVVVLTEEHCLDIKKLAEERKEFYSWGLPKIKTILARKAWLQGYINHCLEKEDYNKITNYIHISHYSPYFTNWDTGRKFISNWECLIIKLPFNWIICPHDHGVINIGHGYYQDVKISQFKSATCKAEIENVLRVIGFVMEEQIIILKNRHDELYNMLKDSYEDTQDVFVK
jgi:hypothetical protein